MPPVDHFIHPDCNRALRAELAAVVGVSPFDKSASSAPWNLLSLIVNRAATWTATLLCGQALTLLRDGTPADKLGELTGAACFLAAWLFLEDGFADAGVEACSSASVHVLPLMRCSTGVAALLRCTGWIDAELAKQEISAEKERSATQPSEDTDRSRGALTSVRPWFYAARAMLPWGAHRTTRRWIGPFS